MKQIREIEKRSINHGENFKRKSVDDEWTNRNNQLSYSQRRQTNSNKMEKLEPNQMNLINFDFDFTSNWNQFNP